MKKHSTNEENDIEILNSKEILSLEKRYVFHGSNGLFDVCEARQASDMSDIQENNSFGIYATPYIDYAICFAIRKKPSGENSYFSVDEHNGKFSSTLHDLVIPEDSFGFVYCFDKKEFHSLGNSNTQMLCKHDLKPLKVYKVLYKDFKDLFKIADQKFTSDPNSIKPDSNPDKEV